MKFLISPYFLTNFEIQKYYQNEPKFNGAYSRNDLSKVKNWAYIINFDECELIETHWIALYVNTGKFDNFDSFGAEPIPKEIKKFKGNKNLIKSIYRIQAYNSIISGYFCIGVIDFMLKVKCLLEYTNLFSPNE